MFELLRSDDPVLLSYVEAGLEAAGIASFIFDAHTSSAYGGALAAVARRIMVADEDKAAALCILEAITKEARNG